MILWIIFIFKFGICYGIDGGDLINIEKAPFVAAIIRDQKLERTGAIISRNCILTSHFNPSGHVTVRTGSSFSDKGGHLEKVVKVFVHPLIHIHKGKFDFIILVIENDLQFTDKIQPVSIPPADIVIGSTLHSFGFGPQQTTQLTSASAEVHAFIEGCDYPEDLKHYMICVKCIQHKGADFGAPLARGMDLYGIATYSVSKRVVFVNAYHSRFWLRDVIKKNRNETTTLPPTTGSTTIEPTKTESSTTTATQTTTMTTKKDDYDEVTDEEIDRGGTSCPQILKRIFYLTMFLLSFSKKYH